MEYQYVRGKGIWETKPEQDIRIQQGNLQGHKQHVQSRWQGGYAWELHKEEQNKRWCMGGEI